MKTIVLDTNILIDNVHGFASWVDELVDFTFEIAEVLGQILRRKTYPKGAEFVDLIVAATAIYLDAPLATRNRADFAKIPDLRFFSP